jgi:arylsulfatase A-like enzyme
MASRDEKRPNIVFILTDDQGAWAMGCAGNHEIETPNLDRLAREGTRCENFFCASPVCSPARASILTGRIPSQHGVHDWIRKGNIRFEQRDDIDPIEYLQGQPAYTDLLAEAGYDCGFCGKWHLGDSARAQMGFTTWNVHGFGGGPYYGAPIVDEDGGITREERYVTDVFTDWGVRYLRDQAESATPFYLSLHHTAPHSPWDRDNHPKELWDRYRGECAFESIPEEPMHPWKIKAAPWGTGERRKDILAGYFAAVTAMDTGVGRVLDALDELGLTDNTIVIFTSDNGMNMGHHGIFGKGNGTFPQNMYDTSVKVPFLIRWPGRVAAGAVNHDLLSHYDIFPTITETVGIENRYADALPGRSFASLLGLARPQKEGGTHSAASAAARGAAAQHAVVVYDEYGPVRMIRTTSFKYDHRYPYGPHELYDLQNDPHERTNLVRDPNYAHELEQLKRELEHWFARYVDPALDGTHEGVTGKGQIERCGPAGMGRPAWSPGIVFMDENGEYPADTHSPFSERV